MASGLETDLREAWKWVHLARLLGVDVTVYEAVDADGMPADANESGPIYAEGGIDLEILSEVDDARAMDAARKILAPLMK